MSNNGFPSLTALLGLLAVAGYQNRDKIGEMLGGLGGSGAAPAGRPPVGGAVPQTGGGIGAGLGGLLGGLASSFGSGGAPRDPGSFLNSGLGELVNRFQQNGHGDAVNSWVGTGENRAVPPEQLGQAIGPDVLDTLTQQTGLSREELLARLSRELPKAVDQYTPGGRLPA